MKVSLHDPARGQPGRPPHLRGRRPVAEIVRVSAKGSGIEVVCLPTKMADPDTARVVHHFVTRKQALRFATAVAARGGAKVVRVRGIHIAEKQAAADSRGAAAEFVARAQARLAALPPGFTDDLRKAPSFPADIPEILGGD